MLANHCLTVLGYPETGEVLVRLIIVGRYDPAVDQLSGQVQLLLASDLEGNFAFNSCDFASSIPFAILSLILSCKTTLASNKRSIIFRSVGLRHFGKTKGGSHQEHKSEKRLLHSASHHNLSRPFIARIPN